MVSADVKERPVGPLCTSGFTSRYVRLYFNSRRRQVSRTCWTFLVVEEGWPEPFIQHGGAVGLRVDAEQLGRETRSFVRKSRAVPTRARREDRDYLLPH